MAGENPFEFKDEAWVVSEWKESLVKIYGTFKEKRAAFLLARKGFADIAQSKAEFIVATDGYLTECGQSVINWIKKNKNYESLTDKDFDALSYNVDIDNDKLMMISNALLEWSISKGYFRLKNQIIEYDSPEAQLKHENEI